MKEDVQVLKEDVQVLKEDVQVLKEDVDGLKKDMTGLKKEVTCLKKDMDEVKHRVKKIEVTLETNVLPRLGDIEACYTSTFERYRTSVEEHEAMKRDISVLQCVVMQHSEALHKIS